MELVFLLLCANLLLKTVFIGIYYLIQQHGTGASAGHSSASGTQLEAPVAAEAAEHVNAPQVPEAAKDAELQVSFGPSLDAPVAAEEANASGTWLEAPAAEDVAPQVPEAAEVLEVSSGEIEALSEDARLENEAQPATDSVQTSSSSAEEVNSEASSLADSEASSLAEGVNSEASAEWTGAQVSEVPDEGAFEVSSIAQDAPEAPQSFDDSVVASSESDLQVAEMPAEGMLSGSLELPSEAPEAAQDFDAQVPAMPAEQEAQISLSEAAEAEVPSRTPELAALETPSETPELQPLDAHTEAAAPLELISEVASNAAHDAGAAAVSKDQTSASEAPVPFGAAPSGASTSRARESYLDPILETKNLELLCAKLIAAQRAEREEALQFQESWVVVRVNEAIGAPTEKTRIRRIGGALAKSCRSLYKNVRDATGL